MGLPRAGSGTLEKYLISTIRGIPPTSVTDTEEGGPYPGFAQPGANNVSSVTPGVVGGFRSGASTVPTVEIKIVDHAAIQRGVGGVSAEDILEETAPGDITTLVRDVGRGLRLMEGGRNAAARVYQTLMQTVRFAIKRTNYNGASDGSHLGVTSEFNRWPDASTALSLASTTSVAPMIRASDGTLRLIFVSDGGGLNNDILTVYSYNPATDTNWQPFTSLVTASSGMTDVAVCRGKDDEDIYIIVASSITSDAIPAKLFTYRLTGRTAATAALTQVGGSTPLGIAAGDVVSNGGIACAALNDGSLLAAVCLETYGYLAPPGTGLRRAIIMSRTADRKLWDPFAAVFGEGQTIHTTVAGAICTAVHFSGATGWMVTSTGRILRSTDSGRTWAEQTSPVSNANTTSRRGVPLRAVHAASTSVAYAVGDDGCILTTIDSGLTWTVLRYAGQAGVDPASISSAVATASLAAEPATWFAVVFDDVTHGWVAGAAGTILYTADGGVTWLAVVRRAGKGAYYGLVSEGSNTIQACGSAKVHSLVVGSEQTRIARFTAANTATPGMTYHAAPRSLRESTQPFVSMARASNTVIYALGRGGRSEPGIWRWNGTLWDRIGTLKNPRAFAFDISTLSTEPACVFIAANDGVWRTKAGMATTTGFYRQYAGPVRTVHAFSCDVLLTGGQNRITYYPAAVDNRCFPAFLPQPLSDGALIFACANMTKGMVEIYRITLLGGDLSFELVDTSVKFTSNSTTTIVNESRPSLTETDYGEVIMAVDAAPAAPTVALGTAGGITGSVQYKTTVKTTATGVETGASKASILITPANQKVTVTFLAPGAGETVELYRASPDGPASPFFYWIAAIPSGTSYTDAGSATRNGGQNVHTSGSSTTVTTTNNDFVYVNVSDVITAGSPPVERTVSALVDSNTLQVGSAVDWDNAGVGFSYTVKHNGPDWARRAPAGLGAIVALAGSDGREWVPGDDPRLPVPVGNLTPDATYTRDNWRLYRQICTAHGGRIFATIPNEPDKYYLATFVSRDWQVAGTVGETYNVPIQPGIDHWILDDMYLRWHGTPNPGDTWNIAPRYDYSKRHLAVTTPSVRWRSLGDTRVIDLVWNRAHADIVAILGASNFWEVLGFALFGSNFYQAYIALSTDGVSYTQYPIVDLTAGQAIAFSAPGGGSVTSALQRTAGTWVPSQFKAGLRQWYVKESTNAKVYRILDNSADTLIIENQADVITPASLATFSDRMFAAPSALVDSTDRFRQYVRLRIPSQLTAEGYYQVGTPLIGIYPSASPYAGSDPRRRYSTGFVTKIEPSTIRETGLSGVATTEHFGRVAQRWRLTYENALWHDVQQTLNPLAPYLRQAFALVVRGEDDTSVELVQMTDGPEITNRVGDRYDWSIELQEVV